MAEDIDKDERARLARKAVTDHVVATTARRITCSFCGRVAVSSAWD